MKDFVLAIGLCVVVAGSANALTRRATPIRKAPVIPAPVITLTPAELAAKGVLDRMAATLNRDDGIAYTGDITYLDGTNLRKTTATVTIEHPARLLIDAFNDQNQSDGTLSADGSTYTLYDSASNTYDSIATSRDLFSLQQAIELRGSQIYPRRTAGALDLKAAMAFPMIFFNGLYTVNQLEPGESVAYWQQNISTPDGKPAVQVTESLTSRTAQETAVYMIDPAANLPVQFTQTYQKTLQPAAIEIQETFKSLKVLRTAQPDTFYAFTPPAGSKAYSPN